MTFVLSMAWRESRGARRRLALTVLAVSLGVAALVAINSFAANVDTAVRAQARTILGADVELRSRRPFPDSVAAVIDSVAQSGVPVSRVTSFGSMVLAPRTGRTRLFEVRAVEGGFPFYGAVVTEPAGLWAALDTARAVLADPALLVQLDARIGDTLAVGDARFVVIGVVTGAPGDVGIETAVAPRLFLPARYLAETNLLRFGSRARYRAYLRIPDDAAVQRFLNARNELFQRQRVGYDTVAEQEEDLTDALGQLAQYLGLVGLVALLLGGLGVGSAVRVFVRDRLDGAAVLRCIGATGRGVLAIYLVQALALGVLGAVTGVVFGIAVQAVLPLVVRDFLPLTVTVAVDWPTVLAGLATGAGTAVLFALPPLLDLGAVPPLRALRRAFDPAPARGGAARWGARLLLLGALVLVASWQAPTPADGVAFAAAVVVTAGVLWLTAIVLMRATRRWFPARASYVVRQGIANLFRPQNQTVAVVQAIGFGVFLIATLYVVQRNLVDQLAFDTRPDRPNFVAFDVQTDQAEGVTAMLQRGGITLSSVTPIVPARIAALNGRSVEELARDSSPRAPSRWALRHEYRNSYRAQPGGSERIVAGAWWDEPRAAGEPPRISMEEQVATDLAVTVGDRVTWNVQGVLVETRIASLRAVEWARFEPNFFVVFEPGVLETAPQTWVVLAHVPDATRRAELQRDVVAAYPNVSLVDLTLLQSAVDSVVSRVALAIRFVAWFSVASGLVILVGALRASRLQRLREAVLLKTLGASARQVRGILLTEYVAWGTLAALTGVLLAGLAGWALVTRLFELAYRVPVLDLAGVWLVVCALVAAVGFATSVEVLRGTPLATLRELSE